MHSDLIDLLFIFMLACFIGFEVIRHVSPLLHTPLMSLTNALDAIAVIGAIVLVGERKSTFATSPVFSTPRRCRTYSARHGCRTASSR